MTLCSSSRHRNNINEYTKLLCIFVVVDVCILKGFRHTCECQPCSPNGSMPYKETEAVFMVAYTMLPTILVLGIPNYIRERCPLP